jgi:hypothetical protein
MQLVTEFVKTYPRGCAPGDELAVIVDTESLLEHPFKMETP